MNDFWGNCTGVVSSRHQYRWRYVRPGARPKEQRESATAQAKLQEKGPVAESPIQKVAMTVPQPPRDNATVREKAQANEKAPVGGKAPAERAQPRARTAAPARKTVAAGDSTVACHPRRRVVGEERPSQDDARRAAEIGWMGAVRYDYGERYQDINMAKDVRLLCGPSSVSAPLKMPYYRCAVEATPCRQTQGVVAEPDERRYDAPLGESQISRR